MNPPESNGELQLIESGMRPKPWHLSACVMVANGCSQAAIARLHDVDRTTVSNLLRQRWFAERVEQLMSENHRSITDAFRGESLASLAVLVSLRDGAMSEAVRAHCAEIILERSLGKVGTQIQEEKPPSGFDPVEEVRRIQAELDRSYEERHRLDPPSGGGQASEE